MNREQRVKPTHMKSLYSLLVCSISYSDLKPSHSLLVCSISYSDLKPSHSLLVCSISYSDLKPSHSLLVCSISYSDLKPSLFWHRLKIILNIMHADTRLTLFSTSADMRTIFKLNGFHLFGIHLNILRERVCVVCVKAWLLSACQSLLSPWSQICCHPFLPAFLLL